MIKKQIKTKRNTQTKGDKQYSWKQFYVNFNKEDIQTLKLQENDEIYISKTPLKTYNNTYHLELLKFLHQLMINKMESNETPLTKSEIKQIEEIEKVIK